MERVVITSLRILLVKGGRAGAVLSHCTVLDHVMNSRLTILDRLGVYRLKLMMLRNKMTEDILSYLHFLSLS